MPLHENFTKDLQLPRPGDLEHRVPEIVPTANHLPDEVPLRAQQLAQPGQNPTLRLLPGRPKL